VDQVARCITGSEIELQMFDACMAVGEHIGHAAGEPLSA
jgi:hypothetical protein